MGSLSGHILPGAAFIIMALWETFACMTYFFQCHFLNKPYRKAMMVRTNGGRSRLPPLRLLSRLAAIALGIGAEYFTALDSNWKFVRLHNLQHLTMYAGFLVPTVSEILYHYQVQF